MKNGKLLKLLHSRVRMGTLLSFVSLSIFPVILLPVLYQITKVLLGFGDERGDLNARDDNIILDWVIGFVLVSGILVLTRLFLFKLGKLWEYFLAIIYFVLIFPVNYFLYNGVVSLLNIPYGDERGEFNDIAIPIFLIVNVMFVLFLFIRTKKSGRMVA